MFPVLHRMEMILRALEHAPACQEADQHTTTHQSTESQLARLTLNFMLPKDTHSIMTSLKPKSVRLMDVKVFEISTSS